MTDRIAALCSHLGISSQYRGFEGQTINVSRDTQVAVLRAMGLDIDSDADARTHLQNMQSHAAQRPFPPEAIVQAGEACELPLGQPADWVLEAEGTAEVLAQGQGVDHVILPALPLGVHHLSLRSKAGDFTTWVLARPASAVRLEDHMAQPRIWGVVAALYGMTDGKSAPIGTYDLLGRYGAALARHGADFLGINPVHAMGKVRPYDVISPYSPSHRAFLNTWHCAGAAGVSGDDAELVDYPAALRNNEAALDEQFATFCNLPAASEQKQAYEAFAARAGNPLHEFALFEAISARLGADWRDWPARYRDRHPAALAEIETEDATAIQRTKWAQWQAETQLALSQSSACDAGMRVGLFLDLAVGPRLGGAETWVKGTSLITGATLGAPPDPLGPLGQNWGLAPQCPLKCRAEGYAGFSRLLRSIMRHAGMIRIDHVLGLMRSFWIPEGAAEGTYVSYPFEALLAVVAIESVRSGTIVVGEDLGLVPEGLREQLAASGIYGLDVLQYMRTQEGGFVDPAETRALAVCTFATHDTPTVAGFFAAEDARVRHELDSIDADMLERTRADRLLAQESLATSDPVLEIHGQLARANASMVAVQLDDIARRTAQQNLPGTIDTYPNWRLKSPFSIQEIAASPEFSQLSETMGAQHRSNRKAMKKDYDLEDCSDQTH